MTSFSADMFPVEYQHGSNTAMINMHQGMQLGKVKVFRIPVAAKGFPTESIPEYSEYSEYSEYPE